MCSLWKSVCWSGLFLAALGASAAQGETVVDQKLALDNADRQVAVAGRVDDLAYLRRAMVDLIGRIPTEQEIREYEAWPAGERRQMLVDKLLKNDGFADRWAVFMADLLRIRSNADGGAALQAFIHGAVKEGLPYDVLCQQLITATGKAGRIPEVGFVLGDGADPMALTATASQVFLGVRIACAQCHDHPFDVWTREQFYGLAAYFGKTARRESELTRSIYAIENSQSVVRWPPEGVVPDAERKVMAPSFPFDLDPENASHIQRLTAYRKALREAELARQAAKSDSLDDIFASAGNKAIDRAAGKKAETFDVAGEAKQQARDLNVHKDLYTQSELRQALADKITNPRNRFFSRAFVNRVWANLLGRGFVEPVDDFSENNPPSHVQTLDYLSDEFVAGGYDLRTLLKLIVLSDAYQRAHLFEVAELDRKASEEAFLAMPVRRMLAESMFDSVVLAGHLFQVKHGEGENLKTVREIVQVPVDLDGKVSTRSIAEQLAEARGGAGMAGMSAPMAMAAGGGGYDLESAFEVDFNAVLMKAKADEPQVEMMKISDEDLEARRMMEERTMRRKYVDKVIEKQIDDNPRFTSAMRMPSPAPPAHFLRVFGQPARDLLGDHRDHSPSMRQALMMLNGKMTHEASRVGRLEPVYKFLVGKETDLNAAVRLVYREILTREPSADEVADARAVLEEAASPVEGMADLRWILFNSHEFRFIP